MSKNTTAAPARSCNGTPAGNGGSCGRPEGRKNSFMTVRDSGERTE
jgi:hypothetical protein